MRPIDFYVEDSESMGCCGLLELHGFPFKEDLDQASSYGYNKRDFKKAVKKHIYYSTWDMINALVNERTHATAYSCFYLTLNQDQSFLFKVVNDIGFKRVNTYVNSKTGNKVYLYTMNANNFKKRKSE